MPRTKSLKPKRNIWADPSPYGTYSGEAGSPDSWARSFEYATYTREKALGILKTVIETPYEILGVSKTASNDQIKSAFRKLVLIHHPDKGGSAEMFNKVMAAYSVLIL